MRRSEDLTELREELERLTTEVSKISGQLKSRKDVLALTDEAIDLKEKIQDLKIEKSRLTEEHDKEKREVQHFVGLEKKRQEVEMDQATRGAKLDVREANLEADKERFEKHIQFVEKRMTDHLGDMKDLLTQVMERIPTVSVNMGRD
jgi:chromosome segregation ATPase